MPADSGGSGQGGETWKRHGTFSSSRGPGYLWVALPTLVGILVFAAPGLAATSVAVHPSPSSTSPAGLANLTVHAVATPSSGPPPLNVTFSATVSGAVGAYGVGWQFGDGSLLVGGNPVSHVYRSAGTFFVQVYAVDSVNDTGTANLTVDVQPGLGSLQATLAISPDPAVVHDAAEFWLNVTGGVLPYVIAWSFGDGGNATGSPVTHTYSVTGNYTVSALVVDGSGDHLLTSTKLSVVSSSSGTPPPPVPVSLSLNVTPAVGFAPLDVTIEASASGGTAPYSLEICLNSPSTETSSHLDCWTAETDWNGLDYSGSLLLTSPGTYAISAVVVDAHGNGTTASATVVVGWVAPIAVQATATGTVGPAPHTVSFFLSITNGEPPYAIEWSFGDGEVASSAAVGSLNHTYAGPGTYYPSVTIVLGNGSSVTEALPTVTVTASAPGGGSVTSFFQALGGTASGPSAGVTFFLPLIGGAVAALGLLFARRARRRRWKADGESIVHDLERSKNAENGPK